MELANILCELLRNPGKGTLGVEIQKVCRWCIPRTPQEAFTFGSCLGNWSVVILDPRLE